jgi:hypothetical protein
MKLNVAASEVLIDNMVLDEKSSGMKSLSGIEQVQKFEDIISEGIKTLLASGFKITKSTDVFGRKKYITVCIEG